MFYFLKLIPIILIIVGKCYGSYEEWFAIVKAGHKLSILGSHSDITVSHFQFDNGKWKVHYNKLNPNNKLFNDNHFNNGQYKVYRIKSTLSNAKKMVYNEYKDYVLFFERNKQVKISSNTCRSNQGSNGFRGGYFSWGVDVIDTRTLNSDNRYCPYNNLNGLGVDVFILDTGLVYPLPSDINANKVTREFDAYQTVQDSFCQDRNGHGTSTAGLIISDIYGVSPNVNLRVYKVLNNNGVGSIADIIDALLAITSGYNDGIISLSIGLYDENTRNPSPALTHVIQSMMTNFIFVIASGNDAKDSCYNYPSNIPGAISVGAITNTKEMAYFTNYGECVSIFSPGVGIVSNGIDNDQYSIYSGSSQATPIVSGVIALYKQYYSGFSNQYIITKVNEFATLNSITKIRPSTANKVIFVGDFRSDNRGVPTQSPSDSFENNNSNNKEILLLLFIITIGAFVLIY